MINLFFVCKVRGIYKQGQYLKEMKKNGNHGYWGGKCI